VDPWDPEARIKAAIRRQPSPTRRQVSARQAALLLLGSLLALACFIAVGGVRTGPRTWSLVLATVVGDAGISAAAVSMAMGRGGQMLGRSAFELLVTAIVGPLAFISWKLLCSRWFHVAPWPAAGFRCLALTLLLACFPLVAVFVARRGLDPLHPGSLGAALGVASGLCAGVLVDLWCPSGAPTHLLLGHLLPIALLALAGAWIGQRALAMREH
jgi:Negative regulator of sigma F